MPGLNLMEREWDFLIILDACRYDFFQEVYCDYLDGSLQKAYSLGSDTKSWFEKNFEDENRDIVYISANPYINSKVEVEGIDARNKFHEIVDVWDWGWNAEIGTVFPEKVNKAILENRAKFPGERIIAHYMQPHFPYLNLSSSRYSSLRDEIKSPSDFGKTGSLRNSLGKWSTRIFGHELVWKTMELLDIPGSGSMYSVWRELGRGGMRQAYRGNLRIVLESISKILNQLDGRIVITSDHGELLGEGGYYGHPRWGEDRILREIPWLEVGD